MKTRRELEQELNELWDKDIRHELPRREPDALQQLPRSALGT